MKSNQRSVSKLLALGVILMLPGCITKRAINWGKETFNQGSELNISIKDAQKNLRSIRIYQKFATQGLFDILWLSDMVRAAYATIYMGKHGINDDQLSSMITRQQALNEHTISFYVLGYQPSLGKMQLLSMEDEQASWSIFLDVDGRTYVPATIKLLDSIAPEYRYIFGKRYNRHQKKYLVTFDARDAQGTPVITERSERITLCLSNGERKESVEWSI